MTVKMGRSEWVQLVTASLSGGSPLEQATKEADTAIELANARFGTLEDEEKEYHEREHASFENKLTTMLNGFQSAMTSYYEELKNYQQEVTKQPPPVALGQILCGTCKGHGVIMVEGVDLEPCPECRPKLSGVGTEPC